MGQNDQQPLKDAKNHPLNNNGLPVPNKSTFEFDNSPSYTYFHLNRGPLGSRSLDWLELMEILSQTAGTRGGLGNPIGLAHLETLIFTINYSCSLIR